MEKSAEDLTKDDLKKELMDLDDRVKSLERASRGRGIWVERLMYWLVVVGLIVAVILMI